MGMWDWLEEQDPAQGSRFGTNGVPPLAASDASALLRLIERGVAARGQTDDDDAGAAQSAREAAAATVARAVKPPYGRDEGSLTQVPEDWVRRMLQGPYSGYPAWPSPANPASPFPPPPSPAASVNAPIDDEGLGETQAERAAAVRTVANAARHPYGRMFESVVANNTPTETESARQAQLAREAWARWLASQGRHVPPPPPDDHHSKSSEHAGFHPHIHLEFDPAGPAKEIQDDLRRKELREIREKEMRERLQRPPTKGSGSPSSATRPASPGATPRSGGGLIPWLPRSSGTGGGFPPWPTTRW
jgi:hypothetical protein